MRVHVVAPAGFDDPARPSGGNIYDRRLCAGLPGLGWDVRVATVPGPWPSPGAPARTALNDALTAIPAGETLLIDGLIASPSADPLLRHADRLNIVILLHMPLTAASETAGMDEAVARSERAVLGAAAGVIVTSEWTRRDVLARFAIPAGRVFVARPGADPAAAAPGDATGPRAAGRLLCVAALAPHKGQDVLVEALAGLAGEDWECVLAGPPDRDPPFVAELRARIAHLGLGQRIRLTGTLAGAALDRAYAAAGLLVVPSRAETYGMVVTEALARALPVLATSAGGLPEALGITADGTRPGDLVPPGDPRALATALRRWLHDPAHRQQLRAAARHRSRTLPTWSQTARAVAAALTAGGDRRPAP